MTTSNPKNTNKYEYDYWYFSDLGYKDIKGVDQCVVSIKDIKYTTLHYVCIRNILGKLNITVGKNNSSRIKFNNLLYDSWLNNTNFDSYTDGM